MSLAPEQRVGQIRSCLERVFAAAIVEVEDDSARHAGHAGARDGRGHFNVRVIAAAFAGKPLIARHRAVYDALGELMHTDIHALSLQALTPEEAMQRVAQWND